MNSLLGLAPLATVLLLPTPAMQTNCATAGAPVSTQTSPAPSHAWIQVNLPGLPGCTSSNRVGYGGMTYRSGLGVRVQALRFDDDEFYDLAVTAYNQEAVYLFYGPWSPTSTPPYSAWQVITADCGAQPLNTCAETPIGSCVHTPSETNYGWALSSGDVDFDGRDELFVSQPRYIHDTSGNNYVGRVYVYKWHDPLNPSSCVDSSMLFGFLEQHSSVEYKFADEVAVGEFDGVTGIDLAVSMPHFPNVTSSTGCNECSAGDGVDRRGQVRIYSDAAAHLAGAAACTGGGGATLTLENPQPNGSGSCNGNFGHHMTARDMDGGGIAELLVNAPGNGGACNFGSFGSALSAGQVFLFKGPVTNLATPTATLEDVNQLPCCAEDGGGGRFGMNRVEVGIAGSLPVIAVGAPRKNFWGYEAPGVPLGCGAAQVMPKYFDDPGGSFRFVATDSSLTSWTGSQLFQDAPVSNEVVGYRAVLANFDSTSDSDFMFVGQEGRNCTPRIVYWDGQQYTSPPANIAAPGSFPSPAGETGGNWAFGGAHTRLWTGGQGNHEQVILGDPAWFQGFVCADAQPTPDGRLLILYRTYP